MQLNTWSTFKAVYYLSLTTIEGTNFPEDNGMFNEKLRAVKGETPSKFTASLLNCLPCALCSWD